MSLDDEMRKVRERQARESRGKTGDDAFQAMLRAALDHSIENLEPHFSNLEAALGEPLDAGSFLIGMQVATLAMQGVDAIAAAKHPSGGPLLAEYVRRAREAAKR